MKKVLFSLLALVFMATVICCDESGNPVENVALKNFANSGCKGNTRAGDEGRVEIVEYSVIHNGYLGCQDLCRWQHHHYHRIRDRAGLQMLMPLRPKL